MRGDQRIRAGGPGAPRAPSPSDAEPNQCPDLLLTWEPGDYADTHDVYLGTDQTAVENATTATAGVYQGNQEANDFDTTPLSLQFAETYYWRVDEVNDACEATPWIGDVWSFTVSGKAYNPSPSDAYAGRIFPGAALTWTPGCIAASHDVYVGSEGGKVVVPDGGLTPKLRPASEINSGGLGEVFGNSRLQRACSGQRY